MSDTTKNLALCQAASRQLMNDLDWRLLSHDEFAQRAARVMAEQSALSPHQACQNVYARALYDACHDSLCQEQAYTELHSYLYRIALHRRLDLADDATQAALLLVFEQIDRCEKPGAFLCFAYLKLLQAIKVLGRQSKYHPVLGLGQDDWEEWLARLPKPLADELPQSEDQAEDLLDCIRAVWHKHPKAHNQLRVVLCTYFGDWSDDEICQRLRRSQQQVYVLRSLGLKKLRKCMAGKGYVVKHESTQRAHSQVQETGSS